jgi:hypothetical protein
LKKSREVALKRGQGDEVAGKVVGVMHAEGSPYGIRGKDSEGEKYTENKLAQ